MDDPISDAIRDSGLVSPRDCLACEVCCRFPESASPLAPFFSNEEAGRARAAGVGKSAFPPGRLGPGSRVLLEPWGEIFRCPAFRPGRNDCSIYPVRPIDCRLYPFMLMFDRRGGKVWLGLDGYCPAAAARRHGPKFEECVARLLRMLDGPLAAEVVEARGLVGGWMEHVEPLREVPELTRRICRSDLGLSRLVPDVRDEVERFFNGQALRHQVTEGILATMA